MVYVDPDDLRWKPIIQTWLNDCSDKLKMKDETKVVTVYVYYIVCGVWHVYITAYSNVLTYMINVYSNTLWNYLIHMLMLV